MFSWYHSNSLACTTFALTFATRLYCVLEAHVTIPVLHVHTHSDKGTVPYATHMWETMRALATHPEALKMTAHCIGPSAAHKLGKLPNAQGFSVPNVDGGVGAQGGSLVHGICVEHGLAMTDDGDIHLNIDSDTVVLAKGWDDYIRLQLLDKGIGIVGATFEDIGGFSSGTGHTQTFKGIPYTAWLAMSPAHRWRDLKVKPNKGSFIHISNEGQSKIYGLPIGYQVLCDVGYQIPEYLHSRNISYTGWKHLKGSKDAVVLKGLSDYHEEFHVEEGIPFVVHHRGSLRHAFKGSKMSQQFYAAVDAWVAKEKDVPAHWTWAPNEGNTSILSAMGSIKLEAKERIEKFEEEARKLTGSAEGGTIVVQDAPPPTVQEKAAPIPGWLKVTIDGQPGWSRYTLPVPGTVDLSFTDKMPNKLVRLEGTVAALTVNLPEAPAAAYTTIFRNLTGGPVTVQAGASARTIEMPQGACWLLVVDVDGVCHAD